MTEIDVQAVDPGHFGVQVREGDVTTTHRVTVPERLFLDLRLPEVDPATVVRESFAFLLEREPATSILRQFSLPDIGRYFPEYADELRRRLSAAD